MACYHPLRAFPVGINPTGKTKYKITSMDVMSVLSDSGQLVVAEESTPIPCGKCIGCRLQYSRDWANRCMLELEYHQSAYFLTLTYNDKHLPQTDYVDTDTGEFKHSPINSLVKRDFQLFMKRLRKNTGQDLRFFGCGEYGSETHRPHYHIIVFGLELNDLKILKQNFDGDLYYTSPTIEKCWKYGFSLVAGVNWHTCAYVARYITKKLTGEMARETYLKYNIEPPFVLMSRRPGIGAKYFEEHFDHIYRYDRVHIPTRDGGKSFKPPRYYDNLYDHLYPSDMQVIKENRSVVAQSLQQVKLNTFPDLSLEEILYMEEDCLLDRLGYIKERSAI